MLVPKYIQGLVSSYLEQSTEYKEAGRILQDINVGKSSVGEPSCLKELGGAAGLVFKISCWVLEKLLEIPVLSKD